MAQAADPELQGLYDEAAKRGLFKADAEMQQIGHELRARSIVTDPTQGGLVQPQSPSAPQGVPPVLPPANGVSFAPPKGVRISERADLTHANPDARAALQNALNEAKQLGIPLNADLTSAYRDNAKQAQLYADYKAGKSKYPAAPPGKSKHNAGLAFDLTTSDEYRPYLTAVMERHGFKWGGNFKNPDPIHYEYTGQVIPPKATQPAAAAKPQPVPAKKQASAGAASPHPFQYAEEATSRTPSTMQEFLGQIGRSGPVQAARRLAVGVGNLPVPVLGGQVKNLIPYSGTYEKNTELIPAIRTQMLQSGEYPTLPPLTGKSPAARQKQIADKNAALDYVKNESQASEGVPEFGGKTATQAQFDTLSLEAKRLVPLMRKMLQAEQEVYRRSKIAQTTTGETLGLLAAEVGGGLGANAASRFITSKLPRLAGTTAGNVAARLAGSTAGGAAFGGVPAGIEAGAAGEGPAGIAKAALRGAKQGATAGLVFGAVHLGGDALVNKGISGIGKYKAGQTERYVDGLADRVSKKYGFNDDLGTQLHSLLMNVAKAAPEERAGRVESVRNFLDLHKPAAPKALPPAVEPAAAAPRAKAPSAPPPVTAEPRVTFADGTDVPVRAQGEAELTQLRDQAQATGDAMAAASLSSWVQRHHDWDAAHQVAGTPEQAQAFLKDWERTSHPLKTQNVLLQTQAQRAQDPQVAQLLRQAADDAQRYFQRDWAERNGVAAGEVPPAPQVSVWRRLTPEQQSGLNATTRKSLLQQDVQNSATVLGAVPDTAVKARSVDALQREADTLFGQAQERLATEDAAPSGVNATVSQSSEAPESVAIPMQPAAPAGVSPQVPDEMAEKQRLVQEIRDIATPLYGTPPQIDANYWSLQDLQTYHDQVSRAAALKAPAGMAVEPPGVPATASEPEPAPIVGATHELDFSGAMRGLAGRMREENRRLLLEYAQTPGKQPQQKGTLEGQVIDRLRAAGLPMTEQTVGRVLSVLGPIAGQPFAERSAAAKKLVQEMVGEKKPDGVPATAPEPAPTPTTPATPASAAAGRKKPGRYHGSSSPVNLGFSYDREQYQNLYGPGLYTTDDIAIGRSYTKKGRGKQPSLYEVRWVGKKPPRLLDLEKPVPAELRHIFEKEYGNLLTDTLDFSLPGKQIYEELKEAMAYEHLTVDEVQEIMHDIADALADAGYDGFAHVGGKGDRPKHSVEIYFHPKDPVTGKPNVELTPIDADEPPAPVETPTPAGPEQRANLALRKRVDEMTPAEKDEFIRTLQEEGLKNPVTGLPNRLAYKHAEKKPWQAEIDADSLKWWNDEFKAEAGDAGGDALLKAVAYALQEVGVEAYHIGGDEFVVQGTSAPSLKKTLEQANDFLKQATIAFDTVDGKPLHFIGAEFSYGIGKTIEGEKPYARATQRLAAAKSERERSGTRAPRGEQPPGVVEVRPEARPAEGRAGLESRVPRRNGSAGTRKKAAEPARKPAAKPEIRTEEIAPEKKPAPTGKPTKSKLKPGVRVYDKRTGATWEIAGPVEKTYGYDRVDATLVSKPKSTKSPLGNYQLYSPVYNDVGETRNLLVNEIARDMEFPAPKAYASREVPESGRKGGSASSPRGSSTHLEISYKGKKLRAVGATAADLKRGQVFFIPRHGLLGELIGVTAKAYGHGRWEYRVLDPGTSGFGKPGNVRELAPDSFTDEAYIPVDPTSWLRQAGPAAPAATARGAAGAPSKPAAPPPKQPPAPPAAAPRPEPSPDELNNWETSNRPKIPAPESSLKKGVDALRELGSILTRTYRDLRGDEYAQFQQFLTRYTRHGDAIAAQKAQIHLRKILDGLSKEERDAFELAVVRYDLRADLKRQKEEIANGERDEITLPKPHTEKSIEERAALSDADLKKFPKVKEAIELRRKMNRDLPDRYMAQYKAVFKRTPKLDKEDYFHRQMIDDERRAYLAAGRSKLKAPKKAVYEQHRTGTLSDYNKSYIEPEFAWVSDMNKRMLLLDVLGEAQKYDIAGHLKRVAAHLNDEKLTGELEAVRDGIKAARNPKDGPGYKKLLQMAAEDVLPDTFDGRWDDVTQMLKTPPANGPGPEMAVRLHHYVDWLLEKPKDTSVGSLMHGSLLRDAARIREKKGGKKVAWEDLVPEGFAPWAMEEGNQFAPVWTAPNRVVDQAIEQNLKELSIPVEALKKAFASVGRKPVMVLPEGIAKTLEREGKPADGNPVAGLVNRFVRAPFVTYQLFAPHKALGGALRDFVGNVDASVATNPDVFNPIGRGRKGVSPFQKAIKDVIAFAEKNRVPSPELESAIGKGLFSSHLTHIESEAILGHLNLLKGMVEKEPQNPYDAFRSWYLHKAQTPRELPETILRYAHYLSRLDQVKASPNGIPDNIGASNPRVLRQIADDSDRAWYMSNHDMVPLDEASEGVRYAGQLAGPFMRWAIGNDARYVRLLQNSWRDPRVSAFVGRRLLWKFTKVAAAGYVAARFGAFALKALAFTAMMDAWNHWMHGEDEKRLPYNVRKRPHIIAFDYANGQPQVLTRTGAVPDALAWFGLDDSPGLWEDYVNGRKNLQQIAEEMVKGSGGKAFGLLAPPFIVSMTEAGLNRRATAEPFQGRQIGGTAQRLVHAVSGIGPLGAIEEAYQTAAGGPQMGERLLGRGATGLTGYDLGKSQYDEVRQRLREWGAKHGKPIQDGAADQAVVQYRLAIRLGDKNLQAQLLQQLAANLKTRESIGKVVENLSPIRGMHRRELEAYVGSLSPDDQQRLREGMAWYRAAYAPKATETVDPKTDLVDYLRQQDRITRREASLELRDLLSSNEPIREQFRENKRRRF